MAFGLRERIKPAGSEEAFREQSSGKLAGFAAAVGHCRGDQSGSGKVCEGGRPGALRTGWAFSKC